MPKNLGKIKELKDYKNRLNSVNPPNYNIERVNDIHKELDLKIREYWEEIHPILQDFIYSFAFHWNNSEETLKSMSIELKNQSNLLENFKDRYVQKFNELISEKSKFEQELIKKDQIINVLQNKSSQDQNEIKEIIKQFDEKIKEYGNTEHELGKSFQFKIMNMEADLSTTNQENESLKKEIKQMSDKIIEKDSMIQNLQSKINEFEKKLAEFSNLNINKDKVEDKQ